MSAAARPPAPRRLRAGLALAGSFAAHAAIVALAVLVLAALHRARPRLADDRRVPDEIVAMSSVLRIERRSPSAAAARTGGAWAEPAARTRPRGEPQPSARRAADPRQAARPHELSADAPGARAARTRSAGAAAVAAGAREHEAEIAAGFAVPSGGAPRTRRIAAAAAAADAAHDVAERTSAAAASARSAEARAAASAPPAARERSVLDMDGKRAKLAAGQGRYYPVRSWHDGGLDWYDMAYEYQWPKAPLERGTVPWPVSFAPDADPFTHGSAVDLARTPLPKPPDGYVPPTDLGRALRAYFPDLTFDG